MKKEARNYIDVCAICIVCIVIFCYIFKFLVPKFEGRPRYEIQMQDANGLILGSPVFLSGNAVGHVTKVRLEDNQVFITFVLDDKVVKKLPPNCELSVKSSGLGGSKAIDIYQFPTKQEMDLKVRDVMRQAKLTEVQLAMSKQVINSANSMNVMLPEAKLKELKYFMKEGIVTEQYVTIFDNIIEIENSIQANLKNKLKEVNKTLEKTKNGSSVK